MHTVGYNDFDFIDENGASQAGDRCKMGFYGTFIKYVIFANFACEKYTSITKLFARSVKSNIQERHYLSIFFLFPT
jgi:hypothetical protein